MNRLEQLRQFAEDDPKDPFNLYALALEYLKSDLDQAEKMLDRLLNEHELYLPTYYQAATLKEQRGNRSRALDILEKGIAIARQQSETKTQRELQAVYDELSWED
jgi:DNA-binding SARP family transcriptional activator